MDIIIAICDHIRREIPVGALKCQVECVQVVHVIHFLKRLSVYACVRACVCVCVRACVEVRERVGRQTPAPFRSDGSLWDAGSAADLQALPAALVASVHTCTRRHMRTHACTHSIFPPLHFYVPISRV